MRGRRLILHLLQLDLDGPAISLGFIGVWDFRATDIGPHFCGSGISQRRSNVRYPGPTAALGIPIFLEVAMKYRMRGSIEWVQVGKISLDRAGESRDEVCDVKRGDAGTIHETLYDTRVVETPTSYWKIHDVGRYGVKILDECPRLTQERVGTSAIWCGP